MKRLGDKVKAVYSNKSKYGVQNLIVSTSDSCGEGEHKLFEYIRTFPQQHQGKNTIIYGLDADLIMLSINHLPVTDKIYLFRETPHFIKTIQPDLDPNESYIIDIPELARVISSEMNNNKEEGQEQQQEEQEQNANSVYDYIFMCFFLGNDFMPHFPAVNIRTGGVDKMINMYKATIGKTSKKNLTDGKTIFWGNVRELVSALAEKEEDFLQSEAKLRDRREKHKINPSTPEEKFQQFESLPTYDRPLEKYINPFKPNWRLRYYKCLFKNDITEENIQEICINYLEGLEWIMKYYTQGCADWRWCYNYHYPPLLGDLLRYMPLFEREFITNKPPKPVSELVQLCYVLPLQSLHLLPSKLYDNLIREHIGWYKNDCKFVWAYCRYFWEAHVVMPEIDINELEAFVQKNSG
jgi:5'-3' exonuclease